MRLKILEQTGFNHEQENVSSWIAGYIYKSNIQVV